MHKRLVAVVLALALVFSIGIAVASAEDKAIDLKITDVVEATTKTGNPYIRMIVSETRMLQGVSYEVGVPVMVFPANLVEQARSYKTGDTLKAIVKERKYQGRESYTLMAFLP